MGEKPKFWKGQDFRVTQDTTVVKSALVPIMAIPGGFPPEGMIDKNEIILMSSSMKSLRAQEGLTMANVGPQLLLKKESEVFINVINLATRPIYLPAGSGLLRLYHESPELAVTGEELVSAFKTGRLKIEGKQGVDWQWSYKDRVNGANSIAGIYLRIKPEGRKWIPPDPNNAPIIISDQISTGVDYRNLLDPFFEPIPETDEKILWVGDTAKLTVGAGLEGILGRVALHAIGDFGLLNIGSQSESRLFDGNKTDWEARVEVFGPTAKIRIANIVHMRIVRSG